MYQYTHAAGTDLRNTSLTEDKVTVKRKTFQSHFNKLLCREKDSGESVQFRSLSEDYASSQKLTVKKQGKFYNR